MNHVPRWLGLTIFVLVMWGWRRANDRHYTETSYEKSSREYVR